MILNRRQFLSLWASLCAGIQELVIVQSGNRSEAPIGPFDRPTSPKVGACPCFPSPLASPCPSRPSIYLFTDGHTVSAHLIPCCRG